ncbi:FkbM family methyltransferase [Spirillospora sp. NPDC047279]|uniref:FkbM family methyltransferase n=1 Tax=Spirillospora sp. NPDC047279 TaxID=3155478 RepID=UPI0033CFA3A2
MSTTRGATTASLIQYDGLSWALRPASDDRVGPGPHEQDIWRLAASFATPGSAFVDVGAHVGHYSLRLSRDFTRVIAVEPNPAALYTLHLNLRLNDITNVTVHPVAAHASAARLRLWDPYNVTAGACTRTLALDEPAILPADGTGSAAHTGVFLDEVDARPIDLIAASSPERIALIKIDIEGLEGRALAGAADTLRAHRPALLIEMHDSMYGHHIKTDVLEQLSRHNYTWCEFSLYQRSKMTSSDMCPYLYAEPPGTGRAQEFLDFADRVNEDAPSRWVTVL